MPDVTLKMTDQTFGMIAQYTDNGTTEEVQTLMQEWFDWIAEIGWGWTLDLQMQIESLLDAKEEAADEDD
jgi:hypothetical protein